MLPSCTARGAHTAPQASFPASRRVKQTCRCSVARRNSMLSPCVEDLPDLGDSKLASRQRAHASRDIVRGLGRTGTGTAFQHGLQRRQRDSPKFCRPSKQRPPVLPLVSHALKPYCGCLPSQFRSYLDAAEPVLQCILGNCVRAQFFARKKGALSPTLHIQRTEMARLRLLRHLHISVESMRTHFTVSSQQARSF